MKSPKKIPNTIGKIVMIYGEPAVGKTVTAFASAPLPMAYLAGESRDYRISVKSAIEDAGRVELVEGKTWFPYEYSTWDDSLDFIYTHDFSPYATVMYDGLSHVMIGDLAEFIAQNSFEAQLMDLSGSKLPADIKEKQMKELKGIINRNKLSQEGYGAICPEMSRLFKGLGRIAQQGKLVIVTALLSEYPKWDLTMTAAPSFKGREFAQHFAGFCDLIGLVEHQYKDGGKVFPPIVSFEHPQEKNFVAKFTGVRPRKDGKPVKVVRMELDFNRIATEL